MKPWPDSEWVRFADVPMRPDDLLEEARRDREVARAQLADMTRDRDYWLVEMEKAQQARAVASRSDAAAANCCLAEKERLRQDR